MHHDVSMRNNRQPMALSSSYLSVHYGTMKHAGVANSRPLQATETCNDYTHFHVFPSRTLAREAWKRKPDLDNRQHD